VKCLHSTNLYHTTSTAEIPDCKNFQTLLKSTPVFSTLATGLNIVFLQMVTVHGDTLALQAGARFVLEEVESVVSHDS